MKQKFNSFLFIKSPCSFFIEPNDLFLSKKKQKHYFFAVKVAKERPLLYAHYSLMP